MKAGERAEKAMPGCESGRQTAGPERLPDHLFALPGGQWALWRWVGVRGAGFPAQQLLLLACPDCAAAADRLNKDEDRRQEILESASGAIRRELAGADEGRRRLKKVLEQLKKGVLPKASELGASTQALLDDLEQARERSQSALGEFRQAFDASARRTSEVFRALASSGPLREAITWQNRQALHTAIYPLLRKLPDGHRGSKQRQYEQLIANYLQRYCAKNDTIGFFGPVGWARIVAQAEPISARPGAALLAERKLYFESWCMDSLVEKFGSDESVLPWIAPRRTCSMRVEGDMAFLPFRRPTRVREIELAIIRSCDGRRSARQIAQELVRHPLAPVASEAEVFHALRRLQTRGMIWWKFELPLDMRPELALRRMLDRIGEEPVRASLRSALNTLEDAFHAVERAAGDCEKLDSALDHLDSTFTALTGKAATRSGGKAYAGRTLVYEDCRRDLDLRIGSQVMSDNGPALSLVLNSARWLVGEIARAYRKVFERVYASLADQTRTLSVNFGDLWLHAQGSLFARADETLAPVQAEFQKRWSRILSVSGDDRRVFFSADDLKTPAQAEFAAASRVGSFGRYHSPDLMIAAPSIEAICRGEYQAVLGELHVGVNTLGWPLFLNQHPSPEELFLALKRDMPGPRLVPIIPKGMFGGVTRVLPALTSPGDFRLDLAPGPCEIPDSQYIPISELVVEDRGSGLVVRTRDGRLAFDLIEAFAEILNVVAANRFRILPPRAHLPRVSIDRLVVCRESWHFRPSDLEFSSCKAEADRYASARRWGRRHNLPRFVFVKVPAEIKPFYVDFESPIYLEIFAKMIRREVESGSSDDMVRITEMLPRADEAWLPGPDGQRYTSELRLVAVDLNNYSFAPSANG